MKLPALTCALLLALAHGAATAREGLRTSDEVGDWRLAQAGDAPLAAARSAGDAGDDADEEPVSRADRQRPAAARTTFRPGLDQLLLEWGAWPDRAASRSLATVRATPYLLWQPSRALELRASVRLDAYEQAGGSAGHSRARAEPGDTYLRYRVGETRLTVGAQTIIWGRVDEIPLADRVSRADLTRLVLDDLPQRRLAQPAIRWEQTWGDFKLDAVWLAGFRGAALPDPRSVWSTVNPRTGEVLGLALTPEQAGFVRLARIEQADGGRGGEALRLTHSGTGGADLGLTVGRTRQSQPWLAADPARLTLTALHPFVRFAGMDGEWTQDGQTWRAELMWSDGVPATSATGERQGREVLEGVAAVEFFPGGEDTRVNLQLAARSVRGAAPLQELRRYSALNGEIESTLAQGRWRAGMRFNAGLNMRDLYLSPRLSWLGWEPHEWYVAAHLFDGEARTLGGFHRRHGFIAIGLKTRL